MKTKLVNDEKKDYQGIIKFKRLCDCLNYNFLYDENAPVAEVYDGVLMYKGRKYLIEVKDRDPQFSSYKTLLFEVEKYDGMKRKMKEENAVGGYYVSIFTDDIYIYYVPNEMKYQCKWVLANKYTYVNEGKIWKQAYFVPKNEFKKYVIDGKTGNYRKVG